MKTSYKWSIITNDAIYVDLGGDEKGSLSLIANGDRNIYFSYDGLIVGKLLHNRCSYIDNVPERVKKYIREIVKTIKNGTFKIVTAGINNNI